MTAGQAQGLQHGSQDAATRALLNSVLKADVSEVTAAVRNGANVNAKGPDGLTPLMVACGLGQAQAAALLLTAGADPLAMESRMGAAAIHKAAQSGNADVIALLLEHGAFIDHQSPVLGNTALMDAVLHKREGAVKMLLKRGARTTIKNHWQQTALDLAHQDGLAVIANLLQAQDAENAENVAALTLIAAVKAGNEAEVDRLVASGADIEVRVPITGTLDDDYTPLGLAVRHGHAALVRRLLDAGADPRRTIGLMRGSPLHEAAYLGMADQIEILVGPTRYGPSPVEIDAQGPYNGLTALHDAVWHGHREAVQALLRAKASTDLKTHAGLTARGLALLYGYAQIAELLEPAVPGS